MCAAFSRVKKWFNSAPFGLSPTNGAKPTGFKAYSEAEELFPYTRLSFLGLSKEASKASADHEIRPILVDRRELPLNAGYKYISRSHFKFTPIATPISRSYTTHTLNSRIP